MPQRPEALPRSLPPRRILLCAVASLALAAPPGRAEAQQPLTSGERLDAARYLEETEAQISALVEDLSDEDLRFQPGPGAWSLAQIVEHLTLVEGVVQGILLETLPAAPPRPELRAAGRPPLRDGVVRMALTNRITTRFQAPERLSPRPDLSPREALERFAAARRRTLDYVRTTPAELRLRFADNPALGMLDGYQWILFAAAHCERHTAQAREVRAALATARRR